MVAMLSACLTATACGPPGWVTTKDGFITLASEVGTHPYKSEDVIAKGRVGPGQILMVDTQTGELLQNDEIDNRLKSGQPYKRWLKEKAQRIEGTFGGELATDIDAARLNSYMKMFQVSFEERDQVLRPLAETGNEGVGSMGDDTPMAVLSRLERSLYDYFRQKFAQVTNPPIDPLRETIVMSLETDLGGEKNVSLEGDRSMQTGSSCPPGIVPGQIHHPVAAGPAGIRIEKDRLHLRPCRKRSQAGCCRYGGQR